MQSAIGRLYKKATSVRKFYYVHAVGLMYVAMLVTVIANQATNTPN